MDDWLTVSSSVIAAAPDECTTHNTGIDKVYVCCSSSMVPLGFYDVEH